MHLNVEIKARCADPAVIRAVLRDRGADFRGTDHQIDTYFAVPNGRLKLRAGKIENNLIHYHRPDQAGPKPSEVRLYRPTNGEALGRLLQAALDVKVVVDKQREIYFIDNVKFHLDNVAGLGTFVEIEAIDADGGIGAERLYEQCRHYLTLFGIQADELLRHSYSDMLLNKTEEDA